LTSPQAAPTGTIIAGVDGSDSSIGALEWAAHQAHLMGSRLEVIMTWEWPTTYGWAVPLPPEYSPAAEAQKVLDMAIDGVRKIHPELGLAPRLVEGHPAPVLVEASRSADLLVVGSRGHGEFVGMLLGSVSEHCVTYAHCPVVVFRERR
jgi:nucleotide-binding universal stress UspA family protein